MSSKLSTNQVRGFWAAWGGWAPAVSQMRDTWPPAPTPKR